MGSVPYGALPIRATEGNERMIKYDYSEGRTNRYGVPIPNNFESLRPILKQSFAMMGNKNAKGADRSSHYKESVALDRIIDRM